MSPLDSSSEPASSVTTSAVTSGNLAIWVLAICGRLDIAPPDEDVSYAVPLERRAAASHRGAVRKRQSEVFVAGRAECPGCLSRLAPATFRAIGAQCNPVQFVINRFRPVIS